MTPAEIKHAAKECAEAIKKNWGRGIDLTPLKLEERYMDFDFQHPQLGFHPKLGVRHILWMCGEIQSFLEVEDYDKANRWLGFVQGCMWFMGAASINQMRKMNKP